VVGPQPPYPMNAPCWLAKGPGNLWYTGNSPGQAVSIFFSDGQGGAFYKSVSLPGTPTDITVSRDHQWLAVIYTAADGSGGRVAVFAIDAYGDLSSVATSSPIASPPLAGWRSVTSISSVFIATGVRGEHIVSYFARPGRWRSYLVANNGRQPRVQDQFDP